MSFRLIAETPTIAAAPGDVVVGRVRIHNDGTTDAVYTVAVVGLEPDPSAETLRDAPGSVGVLVAAGGSAVVDVDVPVPRSLGIGQHAVAFEVASSRQSDRAALTPFTLSIASVARVELIPRPSTIRARRRAAFHLDVTNNEPQPVDVELTGEAPDVDVSFTPSAVALSPGQRIVAKGRLKGPRHWSGESTQHNVLITARGRAATTTTTAAYVQRPVFAQRLRMIVAAVTVVALWLGAVTVVGLWWSNRDDGPVATALVGVDTDGDGIIDAYRDANGDPVTGIDTDDDGIPDTFLDADGNALEGIDTNGDGIPDTIVGTDGESVTAVDTDNDGVADALANEGFVAASDDDEAAPAAQTTVVRGSADIDGDPTDIDITLTALTFKAPSAAAEPIGVRRAPIAESAGKFWPARYGSLNDLSASPVRRTVAIATRTDSPKENGTWSFGDVIQGESYEVSFSSPGFDTQSFVVSPEIGGDPVELDVGMVPSRGALSGTVVGPGGVLGSAAITITDGTNTFATSSDGGTGRWSLEGVSTPGIYTVSAELRGFGTAVRQIELGPADSASDITLEMRPGLGTITGRIENSDRQRLGGVTVTASNGETTLTTTSFTEGDIGFYILPQLPVPGTYTVQAELDGFVTESRRQELNGSDQGDVDFIMTSTTARLTGRVLSSGGGGIESAGLIISTGDLRFRTSTTAAPAAGNFELDRLPPGDYTITVEHFQHETSTQFVTLVAGQPREPLVITLDETDGPPDIGTGSLTVNVINDDETIEPPGIPGTAVTVTLLRGDFQRTIENDDDFSVTFDDLPIGTYSVSVDATDEGYNNSAAVRRSIGLSGTEPVTFRLQRLGTASGTVVNSLDPDGGPIGGYFVSLYRLSSPIDPVGDFFNSYPEQNLQWDTGEAALQTGFWRIEVTSPTGFLVRPDQVIDPSPAVNGRPMVFQVPGLEGAEVLPQTILPIEADPLADITGKIYRPVLNGDLVEFDALDDASLAVTGTCNDTVIDPSLLDITDSFGDTNPAGDLFDTFSLTSDGLAQVVPTADLPTTCVFDVSANGRIAETITFTDVGASNGVVPSDRLGVAALVEVPRPFNGSVFWFDPGSDDDERVELASVAISTVEPAIVDFTPTVATATTPDPLPGIVRDQLSTISDPTVPTNGTWMLDGQVFGTSSYRFVTDNFNNGTVQTRIDDGGRTVVATGSNTILSNDADGQFGVQLTPPEPGTLSGRITIRTNGTESFADAVATATTPSEQTLTEIPDTDGTFSFSGVEAGTWTVAFTTPDNHQLVSNLTATPPGSVEDRLEPGDDFLTGFDAEFIELATIRLNVFDRSEPVNGPDHVVVAPIGIDLTEPDGSALTGSVEDRAPAAPDDGTTYTLDRIPVSSAEPEGTDIVYDVALSLADFDLTRARLGSVDGGAVDATGFDLPLAAGDVATVDLYVNPFRQITGSLLGELTDGSTEGLSVDEGAPNPATLRVERVDRSGEPIDTTDPDPRLVPGPNGTFSIVGPPGFYELIPEHPQYVETPVEIPDAPAIADSELLPGETLPPGVFELGAAADTVLAAPYRFELRTSELSVSAVTRLVGGTPVEGAVFDLEPGTTSCNGFPQTTTSTPIPLSGTTIDVAPGAYCLAVNKFDAGGNQIAFPAVVTLTIPRSTETVSTTTIVAPLPSLRPTLTGRLVAQNGNEAAVDLIATAPVVVTSEFTEALFAGGDTSLPNQTPDSTVPAGPVTRVSSAIAVPTTPLPGELWDGSLTYEIDDVPYGANTVTAPAIEGYLPDAAQTQEILVVDDAGSTGLVDFVYTVATTPIEIDLGPGSFPSLDAAFDDPKATVTLETKSVTGTGAQRSFTLEQRNGSNVLVVEGVAPERGQYRLSFDDALHEPLVDANVVVPLTVDPSSGRRVGTLPNGPVADATRWTGTVQQRTGPDSNPNDQVDDGLIDLQAGAVMTLAAPGGETYTLAPSPPPASSAGATLVDDAFGFDVAPGTYTLTVTQDGYFPVTITNVDLTAAGTLVNRPGAIVIERKATITVGTSTFESLGSPPGLGVRLLDRNPQNAAPTPRPGTTNVYDVRPGTYYAEATADAPYPPQQSADTPVEVGDIVPIDLALPRIARVSVTGASQATAAVVGSAASSQTQALPFTFSFVDPPTPATGPVRVKVTADDRRTQIVDIPTAIINDPAVAVTLRPLATATGSIPGATGGSVTATAPGMTNVTGTVGAGTYNVPGLGVGPNGEPKQWTLSYSRLGTGVGTAATTVDVTSTSTDDPAGPTIPLTVRDIAYVFDVTTPPTADVDAAGVSILDSGGTAIDSGSTNGDGDATVSIAENTSPTTWRVSKPGFLTKSGPLGALPESLTQPITVLLQPAITGSVFDSESPPAAVDNASVVVCPAGASSPCTPAQADRSTTSNPDGSFTLTSDLAPGTYSVWASLGSADGVVALTISPTGAASLSDGTISIDDP